MVPHPIQLYLIQQWHTVYVSQVVPYHKAPMQQWVLLCPPLPQLPHWGAHVTLMAGEGMLCLPNTEGACTSMAGAHMHSRQPAKETSMESTCMPQLQGHMCLPRSA